MTKHRAARTILCALLICALILPMIPLGSMADTARYGRINADKVRFRKTASTMEGSEWWCLLDTGWVLLIRGELTASLSDWYAVTANIPGSNGTVYDGYIMREFLTEMSASDVTAFLNDPYQPNGEPAYTGSGSAPTAAPIDGGTTPPPTTKGPTQAPGKPILGYIKLIKEGVNLRKTPNGGTLTPNEKDWLHQSTVLPYFANPVANGGYDWIYVRYNDMYGYIRSDCYEFTTAPVITPTPTPTAVPGPTPTPDNDSSGFALITAEGAVLRETPSADGRAITALSYGTVAAVLSDTSDMLRISWNGTVGYVLKTDAHVLTKSEYEQMFGTITPTPYVTPSDHTPIPGTVILGYIKLIKEGVNLRETPNGETLTPDSADWLHKSTILPYYAMPVEKAGYNWIYVKYKDMYGYIRSDCYEITSTPDVTPTPTAEPVLGGYVRLIKSGVNVRRSPDGTSIGRLNAGTVMPYYGIDLVGKVTWYYVFSSDLGQFGYVMGTTCEIVTGPTQDPSVTTPPPPPTTPAGPTDPPVTVTPTPTPTPSVIDAYVMTTADKVYLRSQASTASDPLGQIPSKAAVLQMRGEPVTGAGNILWYPVVYRKMNGFVHGSFSQRLSDWQADIYKKTGIVPTPSPVPTDITPPPVVTVTPTVTAAPTETPSGHIMITANKVFVRSGPGTNYEPIRNNTQVNSGEVFAYSDTVRNGNVTWYHIQYTQTIDAYIHGDFARVMTPSEYDDWVHRHTTPTPTPTVTPTPTPAPHTDPPTTAPGPTTPVPTTLPGFEDLTLGSTGDNVTAVQRKLADRGYLTAGDITGVYLSSTMNAVIQFQRVKGLPETGVVNLVTWNALMADDGKTPYYVDGSSVRVELNPVEMVDWYTGDIQSVWTVGTTAIITDVYTGISYRARRWSGGAHADVEPLTSADTAAICKIFGVSTAQDISDRQNALQSWRRRPVWVTIGDRTFAGSVYGVPHNYPDGDTIPDNNYNGQFCVHFVNSMTHGNANNPAHVDYDTAQNGYFGHQSAIKYAYNNSISGKK